MKNFFSWLGKILLATLGLVMGIFFIKNNKGKGVEDAVKKSNEAIDRASTPALVTMANDIITRNSSR